MKYRPVALMLMLLTAGCASSTAGSPDHSGTWKKLKAQLDSVEAVRASHPIPESDRKSQIEALVERQRRLEPLYVSFITSLREYVEATGDGTASSIYARERMLMGDEYARYLARYERAIDLYRSALEADPGNAGILERIEAAENRMFVSAGQFGRIQPGMYERTIFDLIGYPRVDWVKQTVRDGRVFTVWIYPKEDGGAAAVYFDDGVVYHKKWNADYDAGS